MPSPTLASVAGLLLAVTASAQTTWVVDASGGPGSHFTEIQPALNAAAEGDTILVRAGTYVEQISTGKGVQVAADPGVVVTHPLGGQFVVQGLGAGKTFTLSGVTFGSPVGLVGLSNCAGQVYVENLRFPTTTLLNTIGVTGCAQVTLTDVQAVGLPAVEIRGSRVVLVNCELRAAPWQVAWPGLIVGDSAVTVVGGRVAGGAGFFAGAPAISLESGALTLAGASTTIAASMDALGNPVSAVQSQAGSVEIEPAVTMISQNGAPPVGGPATTVTRRIPSVIGDGLGSASWTLELHAPGGAAYCVFVGLPAPAVSTPFGELWFLPSVNITLGCGFVPATERVPFALSPAGLPRGVAVVTQAAVAHSGTLELSTPVVNVVE